MKQKKVKFYVSSIVCFFTMFFITSPCFGDTQDDDKKFHDQSKQERTKENTTIDSKDAREIKNILEESRAFDKNISISKKTKTDFDSQMVNSYISLPNSNFEMGHQYWEELTKSYDGAWYDWDLIIMSGAGGYDNWYAHLMEDEMLQSSSFKIPVNTQNIYLENSAKFIHWGTCLYGFNGVQIGIYDETTDSVLGTVGFFDAETFDYDYEYYEYYGSLANVQSSIGHSLRLDYITYNDDPGCTFSLYLDNISLMAGKDEACIDGKCKVYRFQNKNNGTYLFVASENEANSVIYNYGETFKLEGVAYSVPSSGSPMYRFQNKTNGTYLFTGEEEKNSVIANYSNTFKLEGLAFYTQPSTGIPIYRFRNKSDGTYLFVGENEKNSVLANYAHTFDLEGLAFYAAE